MTYLRNAWYVGGWSHALLPGATAAMTILGMPIVLWRTQSGQAAAFEDRCVHRFAPLSAGRCEGERLRCMYHGLLFDTEGRTVEIPGQDIVPPQARVRRFPVVDRHGWLWVWMGDAEAADPSLIPPAIGIDDAAWLQGHGQLDYEAEACLISENLLDFSHLAYVHPGSFGAGESWAETKPRVTAVERGVRVERWVAGELATRADGSKVPMDKWMEYEFLVPGVLIMKMAFYPDGTAARAGGAAPDIGEAVRVIVTSQAVTPMAAGKARYFFCTGPQAGPGAETARDRLVAMTLQAFDEDRVMIEGQQRIIDAAPGRQVMPIAADKGITLYNNLLKRLSRQEAQAAQAAE